MRSDVASATPYGISAYRYDLCTWGQEQEGRARALHCLDYRGYHLESTKETFQITQIWKNSEGSYTTWTSWQRTRKRQARAFGSRNRPSLERKQHPAMPSTSANATSSTSDPQAAAQLQMLVSTLQSSDQPLSPQEIRQIISETITTKVSSKSMHQAVTKVDQARSKFRAAKKARENLDASWTHYVEESIKRWKTFADDFVKKDSALDKDFIAARDALHNARLHLDDTKERHSKQDAADLGDAEVISDGDGDEESMKMDTSDLIIQGITSMVEGLDKIRVRPAEEEEDQIAAKNP